MGDEFFWIALIACGGVVAAVAWLLVLAIRHWAERKNVFDVPNDRSSHTRPVARGGGMAIAAICLGGWFGLLAVRPDANRLGMVCFGLGAAMIAAVSWLDDLKTLSSAVRFFVHGAAAALLMFGYGVWSAIALPLAGDVPLAWIGFPLVFAWIVGLTNAYNFMDGIDGIAAVQAIVAGIGWLIFGPSMPA